MLILTGGAESFRTYYITSIIPKFSIDNSMWEHTVTSVVLMNPKGLLAAARPLVA